MLSGHDSRLSRRPLPALLVGAVLSLIGFILLLGGGGWRYSAAVSIICWPDRGSS
jgi:hypothetical protein